MKLCDIRADGDSILFDGKECSGINESYQLFRDRYNRNVGKAFKTALGYRGMRTERISGYGIVLDDGYADELRRLFSDEPKHRSYLMGLVGISYCRMFSTDGMPDGNNGDKWLDWVMSSDRNLRTYGRREGVGRTNKKYTNRRKKYGREKPGKTGGTEVHL